ncbi:hypothetical protein [Ramlibacter sp. WS9]|uniref:hypothetical protein n=1 Tax=Ramlibacter sp. WS9 TaxID=1882741 RepID=UPI001143DADE|nr:hypothetical protein [Ramlibacter sp. WS9]ROZ64426.1 hypothetical protein EEB15_28495 [Ramlibacter sp. WS9]
MSPIALVAEDKLTQAVLQKCIREILPNHWIVRSEVKGGRGNVQRELAAYANLSKKMPVLVGVDLDGDECAPGLLAKWDQAENLLVRVAVKEIESWVLADRRRLATFLDAPPNSLPTNPEQLQDPKLELLKLARAHAGTELRGDLVPRNFGQYPRIGPAYNLRMCSFVEARWRPRVAMGHSNSLSRAIAAMERIGAA